jgi:hypothetical protein
MIVSLRVVILTIYLAIIRRKNKVVNSVLKRMLLAKEENLNEIE